MQNPVKEKLARGELVASMSVRLVAGVEIVRIAKAAGFDTLYIDLEHSSLTLHAASQISITALEAGIPALVRVPANTPEYISRAPWCRRRSIRRREAAASRRACRILSIGRRRRRKPCG